MGCIESSYFNYNLNKNSYEIDKQLRIDSVKNANQVKLLLLGAGESGKSTIVKQIKLIFIKILLAKRKFSTTSNIFLLISIRIIHEKGYKKEECLSYRYVVINNTLQSLVTILKAMANLRIGFSDMERVQDAKQFLSLVNKHNESGFDILSKEMSQVMKRIWIDPGVQFCFSRSREYQLNDSAS
jgi:guanine nucleotide-binding protein G(i) subunit alpha